MKKNIKIRVPSNDGRLYLHGENGDIAVVEATPEACSCSTCKRPHFSYFVASRAVLESPSCRVLQPEFIP
jgi:hypothetical protein